MNIIFNITNNLCYNDSSGSIIIDRIIFDNEPEANLYTSYIIQWDGDLEDAIISTDGRSVTNLKNGTYTTKVISTSSISESPLFTSNITSPSELKIKNVQHSEYSCGDNGEILIEIEGGQPPYSYYAGSTSVVSSAQIGQLTGLSPNEYEISVVDSNNCTSIYSTNINIKTSSISYSITDITNPQIYDGPVKIKLEINGPGPFSIFFEPINTSVADTIFINSLETEHLQSISEDGLTFYYLIVDKIYPGSYNLIISNNFGCSITGSVSIPNISAINIGINTNGNNGEPIYNLTSTLPIFDTVLIPYKHIIDNSDLWQAIKQYNLKDDIKFKINDSLYTFKIVRNILDKYCIEDNKIEILKLGNNYTDWFFYFYIAPSINLSTNPEFINTEIKLVHNNQEFNITLGLSNNDLDIENCSLVRGSLILNDLGYHEFINGGNAYVYLSDPDNMTDYDFIIKKIKKTTLKNMYTIDYVTAINFLEQFNVLNEFVSLSQTACEINKTDYEYIVQLKKFIKSLNNFNNLDSVEIANIDAVRYTGSLNLFITGQALFTEFDGNTITNNFDIQYFTFDEDSLNLQQFYLGNNLIQNITSLSELKDGFIIVRVSDIFNNKPKVININNLSSVTYDQHFVSAKKTIQKYNSNILDRFLYGDILVYIGVLQDSNDDIPSSPPSLPTNPIVITIPSIKSTNDSTNTGSLTIEVLPQNASCWIYGPKNYHKNFIGETKFENLIPGVYTIVGDQEYLSNNSLYDNEYRIFLSKGANQILTVEFAPFNQSVFIKDI